MTNNKETQRLVLNYVAIVLTCLSIFYYAVVEKATFKNKLDNQNAKIEQLEEDIKELEAEKVDVQIFQMIIDDLKEIKADVRDIKKNGKG
ncbi:hypothetical protein [Carboxylicivirga sp. RSCT41]|uniref:hypothetical protein n=1 Tax=Carboxylicivirga agarovorans TaxID=3417570 RepID=UPI003D347487